LRRCPLAAVLLLPLLSQQAKAVEPGVDIAVPRVALSTVDDSTRVFHPPLLVVEQGDYVRWQHTGTTLCHTTTSGSPCGITTGLWDVFLECFPTFLKEFTRQFVEPPSAFPYFCRPHCTVGMNGQVTVTTAIDATASDSAGTLTWSGGGGLYRVFRSDNPAFTGTGTVVLTPPGGTTKTSISDTTQPAPGSASFYLVMNQF